MFKIQDFNPIFKAPTGLLPPNGNSVGNSAISSGNTNGIASSSNINNISVTPSFLNGISHYNNYSQIQQQSHLSNEKLLTFTNYYKFCCLNNVNCYFYQFNTSSGSSLSSTATGSSGSTTAGSTYEILKYEQMIKNKLKNDYQINDIITWIAKRELCLFQLQIEDPNENFDASIGFNQLKDAMSNIISENNLSLKLISASTFNADKIFNNNFSNTNAAQNQLQKKSMNVVYLSFLRAVHKYILQKMTKSHSLFETSNQSLSIDILPYSGQLITSSMIQKTIVTTQNSSDFSTTSKKKKIMKKLVPYSILKISPSLNQKNELIINMTSLKKVLYKLTDYINVSCNGSIKTLDEKSKFAIYIAPSGIRCLIAGTTYTDSITDEPPENYEKLFNILKTFNDIDLNQNISPINEKRLWIKIYPVGFNSSNASPTIANYLDNNSSSSKKFIYWPLELCFIQFASDHTPGMSSADDEVQQLNTFEIEDPFQIIDEFIDILDDIKTTKAKEEQENELEKQTHLQLQLQNQQDNKSAIKQEEDISNVENQDNKSEFKFPASFNFKPELDSIDQQLKPLKELDSIDDIIKAGDNFDNLFNEKNADLDLLNDTRHPADSDFQKELQDVFKNDESTNDKLNSTNPLDSSISPDKKVDSNFEEDWGDLFGDSADDEEKNNIDAHVDSVLQDLDEEDDDDRKIDDVINEELGNFSETLDDKNLDDVSSPVLPIVEKSSQNLFASGDQITSSMDVKQNLSTSPPDSAAQDMNRSVMDTSPLYQDPGAPSPIPFQIFAPPVLSSEESSPVSTEEKAVLKPFTSLTPKDRKKSIFSPLNFNPLIEKDIDSKYSNGGKFFVKNSRALSGFTTNTSDSTDLKSSLDTFSEDTKKFMNPSTKSVTPSLPENASSNFNHIANLTTPSFLVGGPGKGDSFFPSNDDLTSDSDDEMLDVVDAPKDDILYNLGGIPNESDEGNNAEDAENEDDENTNEFGDDANEPEEEKNLSDVSIDNGFFGKKSNVFGITVPGSEGNSSKRRKLETIFDTVDDDDELDFEFDDDYNDDIEIGNANVDSVENDENDNDTDKRLASANSELSSRADLEMTKEKSVSEVTNIEIPNSWFYVLRPVSPIQIPFNFLQSVKLKIETSKVSSLLPILQEYVLFSQKYMNNQMLNMLIQSRECPSVLDNDVEYLVYKIFPGICKMNCYELIDSDKESRQLKPFECLFGTVSNYKINSVLPNKQDIELKLFDDNNYDPTSPMLSIPPTDVQQNQLIPQYMDDFNEEFQRIDLSDSIPPDNLFRISSAVLNLKRLNQDIIVNSIGLDFWKLLNLEPSDKPKNFNILFIVPKANFEFSKRTLRFIDEIISYYSVCKLGEIQKLNSTGILEVEQDIANGADYWDTVQQKLLSLVDDLQNECTIENKNKILLMFVDPFQDLNSLIKMADVTYTFESALVEKQIGDAEVTKKKKKRKNKTIARLPITLFYKAFSVDSFYQRDDGQFVVFTDKDYINLALELYNNCPNDGNQMMLKDRSNVFSIEKDIQKSVKFMLTKKPVAKLIENETFLHLCYERSIDKKWCVASWVDQSGSLNFTKSWYIDEKVEGSQSFEKVADDIMSITMDYVSQISGKCFVILTRLNNIIPDDELAEWKRLSMKNNDLVLVVMTAEIESSTLILSNNPGQIYNSKKKEDTFKDVNYTVASTNSQSQTPANFVLNNNNYTHHLAGSAKFESPDVSMYTPSYDNVLSPMDVSTHQVQVPIQPLEPLPEDNFVQDALYQNPILVDISDECYGLILQVSQPLSNQPRVPLKTGFLVNTGEGATKNRVLEVNLLSCQSAFNVNKFLKNILSQYRNLSSLAPFLGISGIVRKCGNVDYDDMGEEDDDDDAGGSWEDENINGSAGLGLNIGSNGQGYGADRSERKKEKQFIQQQYIQIHRMQQRQKRQRARERERDLSESDSHYNVIPIHMLAVRKMLDFLVNIEVE